MGFFDNIVRKVVRGVTSEEAKKFGKQLGDSLEEGVKDIKKEGNKLQISRDYMHFPQFAGTISNVSEKRTDKYERCTLDFNYADKNEVSKYVSDVEKNGYKKMSDVRYEKGNEYIIIEEDGNSLHLVFHIKK